MTDHLSQASPDRQRQHRQQLPSRVGQEERPGIPEERLNTIRQLIHEHLRRADVHAQVRECLSDLLHKGQDGREVSEDQLRQSLRERGVVSAVLASLGLDQPPHQLPAADTHLPAMKGAQIRDTSLRGGPPAIPMPSDSQRYIYVAVMGGRAFLEYAGPSDTAATDAAFVLDVHFGRQRLRSKAVPCSCDPLFDEAFLLELPRQAPVHVDDELLGPAAKVHIAVVRTDTRGDSTLVGYASLDWRTHVMQALHNPSSSGRAVEVCGVGASAGVAAGLLTLRIDLLPTPPVLPDQDRVAARMAEQQAAHIERERVFLVYAKQWWQEFVEIRPSHSERNVPIFGRSESGQSRPVCAAVTPLPAGRLLDTPRHAARFVSLLPYERTASLAGQGRCEQWSSLHAFLARGRGDVEDHALLLCSLLLGFGLDAYVCVGSKSIHRPGSAAGGIVASVPHAWVMTFGPHMEVIFWESLTAERFVHSKHDMRQPDSSPAHPFRTIACVFNHKCFFANAQPSDVVRECSFDLGNEAHWKAMSADAIASVRAVCASEPPPLRAPATDDAAADSLETELRGLISEYRLDKGLSSSFSSSLSHTLQPALFAYELERVTGLPVGNEEFQQVIKNTIPPGHTFKAYPVQFNHTHGRRMLLAAAQAAACRDILEARGDQVVHALRCRVVSYPERVSAVWVMFAVKYKSVL